MWVVVRGACGVHRQKLPALDTKQGGSGQPEAVGPKRGCRAGGYPTEPVLPTAPEGGGVTAVEEWEAVLDAAGELTSDAADRIIATHGHRGVTAIEVVGERRVKGYRDFTVVVGHSEEYVVEDGGCDCEDSRYNLDPEDPEQLCWHVIAAKIARRIDAVDDHDMWYSEVREFL